MTMTVDCPCCHGKKWLLEHEQDNPKDKPRRVPCCHCQGLGHKTYEGEPVTAPAAMQPHEGIWPWHWS